MMFNNPSNPVVFKILKSALSKDLFLIETAFDYDACRYKIAREDESPILKFGFSCHCTKDIMANGGQDMLDEFYKEYQS